MTEKPRVLFLCTHNSARSQKAEGLLRGLAEDRFEVHSAGTEATLVRPLAIRAMDEIGIDISGQESKTLDVYLDRPFDYVITVCDEANEACPFFPGAKNRLHWSFEDPSRAEGSENERLAIFRRVRDEISEHIERFYVVGRIKGRVPRLYGTLALSPLCCVTLASLISRRPLDASGSCDRRAFSGTPLVRSGGRRTPAPGGVPAGRSGRRR